MSIAQIGELQTVAMVPAGAQLVLESENDAFLMGIDSLIASLLADAIWIGTQTEYNALEEFKATTLYVIVEVIPPNSGS